MGRWRALPVAGLLLAACLAGPSPARAEDVQTLTQAEVLLAPDGAPPHRETVTLSHRWDAVHPQQSGRATYRIELPAPQGPEPMGLLFSRVGNQAVVRVNGVVLERLGTFGDTRFDAAKTSWLVPVPASSLLRDGPNVLEVEVAAQPMRWGGLSLVRYGPKVDVEQLYDAQYLWRHNLPVIVAGGFLLMGLTSLALWRRQRVPLYGAFGLAALLGVMRHLDRVWPDVPLPWPAWGALTAVCYALHLVAMFNVALLMLDASTPRMRQAIRVTGLLSATLAVAAFVARQPVLWTAGLAALAPAGLAVLLLILRSAVRQRRQIGWALLLSVALAVAAGVHDLLQVRMGWSGGGAISMMPFASFAIALVMAGLMVQRYNATELDFRALNAQLSQRVQQREDELRAAFAQLQIEQQDKAVQQERQRIMREIHDGIGAQLVGLLNLASKGRTDPAVVEEHLKLALDEMRMAVDSLQPVDGDLTAVLGMLRYRLQPRLSAVGIDIVWDVPPLAPLRDLSPHAALQVQRILLEAFTNVLKHAQASRVTVTARELDDAGGIELSITDDGVGLPTSRGEPAYAGRGLANMRARAEGIGAALQVAPAEPTGTRVTLRWVQASRP